MTSSVPAWISYSVICFALLVAVLRISVPETSIASRRMTSALALGIASCLLRQGEIQAAIQEATDGQIRIGLVQQLSTVALMLVVVPILLVTLSWLPSRGCPDRAFAVRLYTTAGVCGAVMIALGTPARSDGRYIDVTPGWQTMAYFAIFGAWTIALGLLVLRVSVGELLQGNLPRRHALTFVILAVLGAWVMEEAISIPLSGALAATGVGREFVNFRVEANENNTTYLVAVAAGCAALLPLQTVAERLGIDGWTRARRRLHPMWADLTYVCPEVRLQFEEPTGGTGTARQRAHRIGIELRDALVLLTRYIPQDVAAPVGVDRDLAQGIDIARAAERKRAGSPPHVGVTSSISPGRDLREELRSLSRLARVWPRASAVARGESSQEVSRPSDRSWGGTK